MQRLFWHTGIVLLLSSLNAYAQTKSINIVPTGDPIVIDGRMDEESWHQAGVITGFERNFPDDQQPADFQTHARFLYDESYLYAFLRMERNPASPYSISTLKEDFAFYDNDAIGIILDPFNDFTNGYGFYVSAYGVRRDEQISAGNIEDPTMDLKWNAEVTRSTDHYTVEIAIPLKFIRHNGGTVWNLNVVRNDFGANERSSWVRVPINFLLNNLAFVGRMEWNAGSLNKSSRLYSLIPSITFAETKEGSTSGVRSFKPSLDAKVALSSSLNLDITINPDFSQAEADQLQVNLTRFELEFPENRFFFVENSDLFAGFGDASWGNPAVRPFYSRTIGLRYDSASSSFVPKDILGGFRVSGKVNSNLRFGAMSMFTRQESISDGEVSPAQNYSVFALQQKVFSRSNVAIMLSSRQAFGTDSTQEFSINKNDHNRVAALEYNFASPNDTYSGKIYYHTLFDSKNGNNEFARGALFRHNTRTWRNWAQFTQVSEGFRPDAGFVPRTDVLGANIHLAYSLYPAKGKVNQWEFLTNPQFFMNTDGSYSDHFIISGVHLITKKTHDLWLVHIQERIALKAPFDPTFENNVKLDSGTVTTFNYARIAYGSDRRKKFFWSTNIDFGEYYTGRQIRTEGEFSYRIQPYGIVGLNYNVGRFMLPEPFAPANLFYVAPRLEYAFNKKTFLTSIVQYRSQGNNLNYYLRFQWRFGALSDFFIVYAHNRDTEAGTFRSHSLVFKTVIWI